MFMNFRSGVRYLGIVVAFGLLSACGSKQTETEKKLAEVEAQVKLAEAQKQLDELKGTPGEATPPASTSARTGSGSGRGASAGMPEPTSAPAKEEPKAPPPPRNHTLAAGTPISIQTTSMISTKTSTAGSTFDASLAEPLISDGYVIAERGAAVEGIIANADPGGRVKGIATISIGARSVMMADGRRLALKTNSRTFEAKKSVKKDAVKVGVASGIGAAIGAIAGGGKGAAIGAGAGAAGGTGVVLATKGNPAEVPAESKISLSLSSSTTVQESK